MATKRRTSVDYKKDLADLKQKQKALEARIKSRCKEMIEQNPNVHMGTVKYANAPESEVFTRDYLRGIDRHDMETIFDIMEMIEADLASKHPHKQTALEGFNK